MVFKVNIPGPGPGRSRRISRRTLIRSETALNVSDLMANSEIISRALKFAEDQKAKLLEIQIQTAKLNVEARLVTEEGKLVADELQRLTTSQAQGTDATSSSQTQQTQQTETEGEVNNNNNDKAKEAS